MSASQETASADASSLIPGASTGADAVQGTDSLGQRIATAARAVEVAERAARDLASLVRAEADAAAAKVQAAHAEELSLARTAVVAAEQALRSLKDETPDHPWTGKRVFKMVTKGRYWERRAPERVEGVVEMCKSSTSFPANAAYYSRPQIGAAFVRLLKKDGSPGAQFDRAFGGNYSIWKLEEPEAVVPRAAQTADDASGMNEKSS